MADRLPFLHIMKIARDKWRHFYAGIILGAVTQAACMYVMPAHIRLATLFTFLLVAAISYGFELFSKITGKGYYEILDAVATVIGGLLGMTILLIVEHFY